MSDRRYRSGSRRGRSRRGRRTGLLDFWQNIMDDTYDFFDDTMRIGRVMDLLNRSRVQQGFEHQVIADAPQQIERKVGELVD